MHRKTYCSRQSINGLDIEFSLKGTEIKNFVRDIKNTYALLGNKGFSRHRNELKMRKFRRSIFVVKNIKKGEKFSKDNIKRIRPGHGVLPKYFTKILNKKSPFDIKAGEPLTMTVLQKLKIKGT